MSTSAKDIIFRELNDTISQLNITIASQNQLIVWLQESVNAANAREEGHPRNASALRRPYRCSTQSMKYHNSLFVKNRITL